MLVSAKEMLQKAKAGHYAVGQFNINNLEWTKAILLTAQENNSPVILGVSEGAGKYMTGYKTVVGMVNGMMEELNITVPVALHLDHGSYEGCLKCVEAGFSSIMYDGSHSPIDENVANTKKLVEICKEHGMSLEAEDQRGKTDIARKRTGHSALFGRRSVTGKERVCKKSRIFRGSVQHPSGAASEKNDVTKEVCPYG